MPRAITHRYRDPADLIWLGVARRIGWRVVRSADVYAAWDGDRTLTLSETAGFDPDDCLAQMVLHEICHALVEGDAARREVDWGLYNFDDRDAHRERGCLRLQAALADTVGLRAFFGATTDYRPYYDALPRDPLAPGDDPAIALARAAWPAATCGPWSAAIREALEATAAIAAAAAPFARADDLWRTRAPAQHPLGGALGPSDRTCGGCAWRFPGGPGRPVDRCRRHRTDGAAPRIEPDWPACPSWEPPLSPADCLDCGACCRHGFDLVQVGPREPLARARPDLLARTAAGLHLPRPGGLCAALAREPGPPWRCTVYPDRPTACRDFAVAGDACLEARRRVGLTR